jgi:hypothetical protein
MIQYISPHPISLRSILMYPPTYVQFFIVVSFLLAFLIQNPVFIPLLFHACYLPCQSYSPLLHQSNYIRQRVQIMKLHDRVV